MKNTKLLLIIFALLVSLPALTQNKDEPYLLVTDSLWGKELFKFPIHFAPELDYKGLEDARFPKGWSDTNSPEYWSYVFAWSLEGNLEVTETVLESNLQLYFNGLMNVVNKDKSLEIPKTTAMVVQGENSNSFKGKIRLYNAFHTKAMMTLNLAIEAEYCKEENKTLLVFRFSPSAFNENIWKKLQSISLRKNVCYLESQ